ncbi:inosine/xanthosine triphosphatase [Salinimonas marina]|uniref:Inosine/xanthosine triphosphatase n=1 Tax=Salinimonas marina TaxID=2785918 RepID=A0A7S9DX52_9ALTE|nr:inosine/xanthosine triphosphatase [Salinimonas marina]QPG05579.1 inosine/xanthosine triphosphatase [Salinimonas marina]
MHCIVGSANPVKVNAAAAALEKVFEQSVTTERRPVSSGVSDQPLSEAETREGALNRVKGLLQQASAQSFDNDWFVAIEGGAAEFTDGPATFAYMAIYHQSQWSVGRSASLPLPPAVFQALQQGEELGDVMDRLFHTTNIKQQGGAIGLLTQHQATRQGVYEMAMILALAPFTQPAFFL